MRESKTFSGVCSGCGKNHVGKPRQKNQVVEADVLKKYMNLVEWASRKFSLNYSTTQYQTCDFYGAGVETLSILLLRKNSFCSEEEFGKYFKTCLFRRLRQMQLKSHTKKRFGKTISIDTLERPIRDGGTIGGNVVKISLNAKEDVSEDCIPYNTKVFKTFKTDGGMLDVEYNHMIKDCRKLLSGIERKIFDCLVNPPEDLIFFIRTKRSFKEKSLLISGRKEGSTVLKVRPCYVFSYLNKRGMKPAQCREAYKNVKKVVEKYIGG